MVNDVVCICVIGILVIQVNIGKGCYFDVQMIVDVVLCLLLVDCGILFIENVGNLVCLVSFDFGECYKVVVLLVIEGEDKLLKYLYMFVVVSLMLFNKVDLLLYFNFDVEWCLVCVCEVNLYIEIIFVFVISGEGMEQWFIWLEMQ